jgi:hypothetical protein
MWYYALFLILLAALVAYVVVRERRHPDPGGPAKADGQGWGNRWPR